MALDSKSTGKASFVSQFLTRPPSYLHTVNVEGFHFPHAGVVSCTMVPKFHARCSFHDKLLHGTAQNQHGTHATHSVYRRPPPPPPLPRPRPRPPPPPAAMPASWGATDFLGASSTKRASKLRLSGSNQARIVEPLTDSVANETGFLPRL
jgi:hypothetical protein